MSKEIGQRIEAVLGVGGGRSRAGSEHSVRASVHRGLEVDAIASDLDASAFTFGPDIFVARSVGALGSPLGRQVVEHELTHVAQQLGLGRESRLAPRIQRTPEEERRAANERRTRRRWDRMVRPVFPTDREQRARAEQAIERFLSSSEARSLVNELWAMHGVGGRQIVLYFVPDVGALIEMGDETQGYFRPDRAGAEEYEVWVEDQAPRLPSGGITLPTNSLGLPVLEDAETRMASTLSHELLHVWFVNLPGAHRAAYPTGHGADPATQFERVFRDREIQIAESLLGVERDLHAAAIAAAARPVVPEDDIDPDPVTPRTPPRSPGPWGGEIRLDVGGGGGARGEQFAASLGLDLNLIPSDSTEIGLGARGIFFHPGSLMLGGAASLRFRDPATLWFFDLEAGVLGEVPVGDAARISDRISALGGVGIGREIQTEHGRIFIRAGAYLVIPDRQFGSDEDRSVYGGSLSVGFGFGGRRTR